MKFCIKTFCVTLALLSFPSAFAAKPVPDILQEDLSVSALFAPISVPDSGADSSRRTLVFWVNGDADHFVTRGNGDQSGKLYPADRFEMERLQHDARGCSRCTVVILHDPRGSGYDAAGNRTRSSAVSLRVFRDGERILERTIPEINMADPSTLARLLNFAQELDRAASLALVYRGHPILPPGAPGGDAPFDYSAPNSRFSARELAIGIRGAHLFSRLDLVVLAACESAYLETALALRPWARYLVAAQNPVIERLSVSFSFTDLISQADAPEVRDPQQFADLAATTLMSRFEQAADPEDYSYEYALTRVDLDALGNGSGQIALHRLHLRNHDSFEKTRTLWNISDRRYSELNGASLPPRTDLFAHDAGLMFAAAGLKDAFDASLAPAIQVFHRSPRSHMSGLNVVP